MLEDPFGIGSEGQKVANKGLVNEWAKARSFGRGERQHLSGSWEPGTAARKGVADISMPLLNLKSQGRAAVGPIYFAFSTLSLQCADATPDNAKHLLVVIVQAHGNSHSKRTT